MSRRPSPDGRQVWWSSGKIVGSSSSINAMIYNRGHRASYDRWRSLGNPGWGYADLLPYFKRAENRERGASEFCGVGGPLEVSESRYQSDLGRAFLEGCQAVGIPANQDFNGSQQDAAGFFELTRTKGRRASTATAYLAAARRRPNVAVLTDATVTKILFEGKHAIGVEYVRRGRRLALRASREVIFCAGSVKSP
jgi:choline dehydrogenase-like flavoprotein